MNGGNPEIVIHRLEKPNNHPEFLPRTESMIAGRKKRVSLLLNKKPFEFEPVDHMSTESLSNTTRKKVVDKFNKGLVKKLKQSWREATKPELNAKTINELVADFCLARTDMVFHEEALGKTPAEDFEIRTREIAKQILEVIKKGTILLIPTIKRFNILLKASKDYIEEKDSITTECQQFYGSLEKMVEYSNWIQWKLTPSVGEDKDINYFFMLHEYHVGQQCYEPFRKFLTIPLGEEKKDRKSVMKTLKHWNDPTVEVIAQVYEKIESIFRKEITMKNITGYDHFWIEDSQSKTRVSNISHHDIFTGLMYGDSVFFQKIFINGELFYDEEAEGKPESKKTFYTAFFEKLYKTKVDGCYSKSKVKEVVDYAEEVMQNEEGKDTRHPQIPNKTST